MQSYKKEFIEFMLRSGVLLFGDFTTKSGRKTPYFVNTGLYRTGAQLAELGGFYASAAKEYFGDSFNVLFGPAYKGIPLVATTSIALASKGDDVAWCFDRKEVKDHGEGGTFVGHKLADGDRVLIVEDVTTAGTSIRETVPKMQAAADVKLAGLLVSCDRRERGTGDKAGLDEIGAEFSMPTHAIVTIHEVIEHLHNREIDGVVVLDDEMKDKMEAYLAEYGPRGSD
ncbi:MAG: orotate phosphoribosyltransferase [Verrucomicrobiales bacterium]|nr:orotate phosphoribosyltransferase [Verrucomicrobiales bacterium]